MRFSPSHKSSLMYRRPWYSKRGDVILAGAPSESRRRRNRSAGFEMGRHHRGRDRVAGQAAQLRDVGEIRLDPRAVFFQVDPTLLEVGFLPPPATGTRIVARPDRSRAGVATHRWVALRVEAIDRNIVFFHVFEHLIARPIGDRVELRHAPHGLGRFRFLRSSREHCSGRDEARSPRRRAPTGSGVERLDLPNAAAEFALFDALVEEIQPAVAHHRLDPLGGWEDDLDRLVVAVPHAVDQVVGGPAAGGRYRARRREPRDRSDASCRAEQAPRELRKNTRAQYLPAKFSSPQVKIS